MVEAYFLVFFFKVCLAVFVLLAAETTSEAAAVSRGVIPSLFEITGFSTFSCLTWLFGIVGTPVILPLSTTVLSASSFRVFYLFRFLEFIVSARCSLSGIRLLIAWSFALVSCWVTELGLHMETWFIERECSWWGNWLVDIPILVLSLFDISEDLMECR